MQEFDLVRLRERDGLSITEAAQRAGVQPEVLKRAERGSVPRPANAIRIALGYDVHPRQVLWGAV